MASLSLKHIYKVYGKDTKAVNDFNMDINDKEFIVFVGPSGCGKSTTLRMIAGLEEISSGKLEIDGKVVNDLEPKDRNIAMVFQNYALYPHMNVYENMAFSLRTAKLPNKLIHEKVIEAAEILGITEYLDRKPKQLSGGQRQRVALGRAIVRNPKVFLLDEPLSNLDAKLRGVMRAEISRLHEKLQTTFIYVTHDQVEAMTMGDRIVVMKSGFVRQIDTPQNLYLYPSDMFVAGFIGMPQMNFFDATAEKSGNRLIFKLKCGIEFGIAYKNAYKIRQSYIDGTHPVVFGIRPEDTVIVTGNTDKNEYVPLAAKADAIEELGGESLIYAHLITDGEQKDDTPIVLKINSEHSLKRGDVFNVGISIRKFHLFDKKTEKNIKPKIPDENICECKLTGASLSFLGSDFPLPPVFKGKISQSADLILPSDSVILGTGNGKALVENIELFGDTVLYHLAISDKILFAVQSAPPNYTLGEKINYSIDFRSIYIEECGISPLKRENRINGTFIKIKEKENGKKLYRFYLNIEEQNILSPNELSEKLFAAKDIKIFRTPLCFVFSPDDIVCTDKHDNEALRCEVIRVLDYGTSVYSIASLGGTEILINCNAKAGDTVYFRINTDKLTVIDSELNMIIA